MLRAGEWIPVWLCPGLWVGLWAGLWSLCCKTRSAGGSSVGSQSRSAFEETLKGIPDKSKAKSGRPPSGKEKPAAGGTSAGKSAGKGKAAAARTGAGDEEQLSDYDKKGPGATARKTTPPDIPPPSDRDEDGAKVAKPLRPQAVNFKARGRIKPIPRDQGKGWEPVRSRLEVRPERRLHPNRTIQEMGGWLIDPSAPCGQDPLTGDPIPTYVRQEPRPRHRSSRSPSSHRSRASAVTQPSD